MICQWTQETLDYNEEENTIVTNQTNKQIILQIKSKPTLLEVPYYILSLTSLLHTIFIQNKMGTSFYLFPTLCFFPQFYFSLQGTTIAEFLREIDKIHRIVQDSYLIRDSKLKSLTYGRTLCLHVLKFCFSNFIKFIKKNLLKML